MVIELLKSITLLRETVRTIRRSIAFVKYSTSLSVNIAMTYIAHYFEIKRIRKKSSIGKPIDVIFLVADKCIWKSDLLYRQMEIDSRYNPCVIVIPRTDAANIIETAKDTYSYFLENGYKTKLAYEEEDWKALDSITNTDMIFFSNPHLLSLPQYLITTISHKLTCYIPYFEQIDKNYELHFNGPTENLCWKVFQISNIHKDIAFKYAFNRGRNVEVVGYPGTEPFYGSVAVTTSPWKDHSLKKIIIAPHHSIDSNNPFSHSTFLETAEILMSLPKLFRNTVCFAFKPHPLLKEKLYSHPDWGVEKTELYWEFWRSQKNTQFESAEYIELFKDSDAMIHDCASFIIEYLYVNKPCLYLNKDIRHNLNEYGLIGYDAVDKAEGADSIVEFVHKVVNETAASPRVPPRVSLIPKESPTTKIMMILNSVIDDGKSVVTK